ncbi:uncharacterized protein EI90DRAFT_3296063 [Cantharellus anzutake]|uniref:uncharacterized protein n=1 Tax=Cantharellus anzutake TaxID=1750568 RepID=UPI0019067CA1|nr:uncharacterized protein EI90DRAFT_3296063 [Cantharellus anzutake]KAF8310351.1 hypothetical protein EI90DRAFT_3296063 [Cantharellus anzutake]
MKFGSKVDERITRGTVFLPELLLSDKKASKAARRNRGGSGGISGNDAKGRAARDRSVNKQANKPRRKNLRVIYSGKREMDGRLSQWKLSPGVITYISIGLLYRQARSQLCGWGSARAVIRLPGEEHERWILCIIADSSRRTIDWESSTAPDDAKVYRKISEEKRRRNNPVWIWATRYVEGPSTVIWATEHKTRLQRYRKAVSNLWNLDYARKHAEAGDQDFRIDIQSGGHGPKVKREREKNFRVVEASGAREVTEWAKGRSEGRRQLLSDLSASSKNSGRSKRAHCGNVRRIQTFPLWKCRGSWILFAKSWMLGKGGKSGRSLGAGKSVKP